MFGHPNFCVISCEIDVKKLKYILNVKKIHTVKKNTFKKIRKSIAC